MLLNLIIKNKLNNNYIKYIYKENIINSDNYSLSDNTKSVNIIFQNLFYYIFLNNNYYLFIYVDLLYYYINSLTFVRIFSLLFIKFQITFIFCNFF